MAEFKIVAQTTQIALFWQGLNTEDISIIYRLFRITNDLIGRQSILAAPDQYQDKINEPVKAIDQQVPEWLHRKIFRRMLEKFKIHGDKSRHKGCAALNSGEASTGREPSSGLRSQTIHDPFRSEHAQSALRHDTALIGSRRHRLREQRRQNEDGQEEDERGAGIEADGGRRLDERGEGSQLQQA